MVKVLLWFWMRKKKFPTSAVFSCVPLPEFLTMNLHRIYFHSTLPMVHALTVADLERYCKLMKRKLFLMHTSQLTMELLLRWEKEKTTGYFTSWKVLPINMDL